MTDTETKVTWDWFDTLLRRYGFRDVAMRGDIARACLQENPWVEEEGWLKIMAENAEIFTLFSREPLLKGHWRFDAHIGSFELF